MKRLIILIISFALLTGMGWFKPKPPADDPPVVDPPVVGDETCPNPIPVILIHGYLASPSVMQPLEDLLVKNGWSAGMISKPAIPNTSLSADFSEEVQAAVEALLAENPGYTKVDIVGYSRGAKNGLDYILSGGAVRNLVTMDGYMPTKPKPDQTPGDTLYYCIDSSLGALATLDGCKTIDIPANHLMVWRDTDVLNAVVDGLKCNGTNN